MKSGGENKKGALFERKVAKDLSLWISGGKRKDLLWRSSQSGGRATQALKSGDKLAAQAGDLVAVHEEGMKLTEHFVVECKHRKDMGFYNLIVNNKGPLYNFWTKLCDEANEFDKFPLLIFKENRRPTLVGADGGIIRSVLIGETENQAFSLAFVHMDQPMSLMKYEDLLKCTPNFEALKTLKY